MLDNAGPIGLPHTASSARHLKSQWRDRSRSLQHKGQRRDGWSMLHRDDVNAACQSPREAAARELHDGGSVDRSPDLP